MCYTGVESTLSPALCNSRASLVVNRIHHEADPRNLRLVENHPNPPLNSLPQHLPRTPTISRRNPLGRQKEPGINMVRIERIDDQRNHIAAIKLRAMPPCRTAIMLKPQVTSHH